MAKKPPKVDAESKEPRPPRDDVYDKRNSRDYSQRAFDLVRQVTERPDKDAPSP